MYMQCEGDGLGFTVGEKPVNDSHKIRFQLGLHSDAGKGCEVVIANITLEDPGNGEWTDAFRQHECVSCRKNWDYANCIQGLDDANKKGDSRHLEKTYSLFFYYLYFI